MQVEISREPKWSRIQHLFVLLTEKAKAPSSVPKALQHAVSESGFSGRSDESITLLAEEPRKVTLLGLGKEDALTLRGLRTAVYAVAKIARKHRDSSIAVVFPYTLPGANEEQTTRLVADYLAQADYKYDAYLTTKKSEKPPAISAHLVGPGSIEPKQLRRLQAEARAL
ncbi:MAG: M17 family peptidase N-terminal domain-containing protein, partial [Acidobacteriota bacterium]